MRTIKDAATRKNEILDICEALFGQQGFDATSTSEILTAASIARGTLYYHFKSKEDIMDALIERQSQRLLSAAKTVSQDKSKSVYQRIVLAVMVLKMEQTEPQAQVIEHIHKPQNALMHQKVQCAMVNGLTPILTQIIAEGIEQGLFSTPFPFECMEMMVVYAQTVFDSELLELNDRQRATRAQALIFNLERLLGVESGTFAFASQLFDSGETL